MTESELRKIVDSVVNMCNYAISQGINVRGEQIEAAILSYWPHRVDTRDAEYAIGCDTDVIANGIEEWKLNETTRMTDEEYVAFLQHRRDAGLQINPATAEVCWHYEQEPDPYGIGPRLPFERDFVPVLERYYFARSPGSDIWVEFRDLPHETRDALWETHGRNLVFTCGAWTICKPK